MANITPQQRPRTVSQALADRPVFEEIWARLQALSYEQRLEYARRLRAHGLDDFADGVEKWALKRQAAEGRK